MIFLIKVMTIFMILALMGLERFDNVNNRKNRWERQRSKNLMSCYWVLLIGSIVIMIFE